MREMFDLGVFCEILNQKLIENNLTYHDFVNSEYGSILSEAIAAVPLDNRAYTEYDVDFFVKVNYALINKFRSQLYEEYGTSFEDISLMFQKLYQEEYERDPRLWYEQGMGINEIEED